MAPRYSELGMYQDVISGTREGTMSRLVLSCGHVVRPKLSGPKLSGPGLPAQARCTTCGPVRCEATNRDGGACELPPGHKDLRHEKAGRRWGYDARSGGVVAVERS
jgi:hypothetical protein